jgi:large repetitive protein
MEEAAMIKRDQGRALWLAALTALFVLALAPAAAQAGQVGVTVSIQGGGHVTVVEGSIEDGASGVCNWTSVESEWVVNTCERFRNEEVFEAWVWLRATPRPMPTGHWRFAGWTGCHETRERDGHTECAVHSGAFNNVEATPRATFADDLPPTVSSITESFSSTVERTVSYFFSTNEGTLQCRFDSEVAFTSCSNGVTKTYADEGVHTIEVHAYDGSGQVSSPVSRTVTVVDTAIDAGPAEDSLTSSRSATFTFSSGAGNAYECSVNLALFTSCAATTTFSNLGDGTYNLRVRAKIGGWFDRIPATRRWHVDGTPPQTVFEEVPPSFARSTTATFEFGSNEAGTFRCKLDGGLFHVCTSPRTWTNLAQGPHTVRVWARDQAGNLDPTPAIHSWTVDTLRPDTTIVSGPSGPTRSTSATFDFSSNEAGVTYLCRLDAVTAPCSDPRSWTGLAQGSHTLTVWARDAAGNYDATPAVRTWTVDTIRPDTFLSGPSGTVTSTSATFDFSSNEANVTYLCRLDTATAPCSDPKTYTGLSVGSHTLTVWARDAAGNYDATPATRTWTVAPTRVTRLP